MTTLYPESDCAITERDKLLTDSIFTTMSDAKEHGRVATHIEREDLCTLFNSEQVRPIDRVYAINPSMYGFKGPYVGIEPIPKDLMQIKPQPFHGEDGEQETKTQYLPKHTFEAYRLMAMAIENDPGRPLLIAGSYRTSAHQALTFLSILKMYEYDIAKTVKRVAVPGYSEHGTPSKFALDFQNIDGLPSHENPLDFEDTEEYRWLVESAVNFDFYMSYPEDNNYGVMYEPWHWRHITS